MSWDDNKNIGGGGGGGITTTNITITTTATSAAGGDGGGGGGPTVGLGVVAGLLRASRKPARFVKFKSIVNI